MNVLATINIGIDPNIFELGPFLVTWHGFFTALGIAAVVLWAVYQGRKHGIHEDAIYGTAVWAVLGGLIGARLVHVVDNWDYYIQDPILILRIYEGGIGLLGGILGATIAGIFLRMAASLSGWPHGGPAYARTASWHVYRKAWRHRQRRAFGRDARSALGVPLHASRQPGERRGAHAPGHRV